MPVVRDELRGSLESRVREELRVDLRAAVEAELRESLRPAAEAAAKAAAAAEGRRRRINTGDVARMARVGLARAQADEPNSPRPSPPPRERVTSPPLPSRRTRTRISPPGAILARRRAAPATRPGVRVAPHKPYTPSGQLSQLALHTVEAAAHARSRLNPLRGATSPNSSRYTRRRRPSWPRRRASSRTSSKITPRPFSSRPPRSSPIRTVTATTRRRRRRRRRPRRRRR